MLKKPNKPQLDLLEKLFLEYHDIFCFKEDERGETNLNEFKIDIGDESPRKQPVRRTPFAARKIANQLDKMQRCGVITP